MRDEINIRVIDDGNNGVSVYFSTSFSEQSYMLASKYVSVEVIGDNLIYRLPNGNKVTLKVSWSDGWKLIDRDLARKGWEKLVEKGFRVC
jgi:hypothetical protein